MADNDDGIALVQAARQMMTRSGRSDLKVRNVCREAGVSAHSFYAHFTSKDDLLIAVLEGEVSEAADYLRSVVDSAESPARRVLNYVHAEIDRLRECRVGVGSLVYRLNWRAMLSSRPDVFAQFVANLTAPLAEAIAAGVASGELQSSDPVSDAHAIYFLIRSNALDWPVIDVANSRSDWEASALNLISCALGLPGEAAPSDRV